MDSGGVDGTAWEQKAFELGERPQIETWSLQRHLETTLSLPILPPPTQGNGAVLTQLPKVPCLTAQLVT